MYMSGEGLSVLLVPSSHMWLKNVFRNGLKDFLPQHVVLQVRCVYLSGSISIDGDHVFNTLFDFELNVKLSLQGSNALLVGRCSALCPGRLWALICTGKGNSKKKKRI